MGYTAAIFDMDGTILDTSEDLATSLDTALKQTGHKHTFSCRDVGSFFGSGAQVAVMRALATEAGLVSTEEQLEAIGRSVGIQDLGLDEAEVERVRSAFAVYYRDHCNDHTQPYPGILGLLSALRQSNIVCAVVSNKMDPEVRRLADLHFPGLLRYQTPLVNVAMFDANQLQMPFFVLLNCLRSNPEKPSILAILKLIC